MIPIHVLLNRIWWDKEFGKGIFEIGYYDRMERKIIRVSLEKILLEMRNHATFQLMDVNEELQTIPFHRVREVYKDWDLIWSRSHWSMSESVVLKKEKYLNEGMITI